MTETIKPPPEGLPEKELEFFPKVDYPEDFKNSIYAYYEKYEGVSKNKAKNLTEAFALKTPSRIGLMLSAELISLEKLENDAESNTELSAKIEGRKKEFEERKTILRNLIEDYKKILAEKGLDPNEYLSSSINKEESK